AADDAARQASMVITMAHELGHGAFTLKHTFADNNALPQGTTDNLMDYNNGTHLWKLQWDRIHDPATVLGLFEGDDSGASVNNEDEIMGYIISDAKAYIRMIAPPNQVKEPKEVLPQGTEIVLVSTTAANKFSAVKFLDKKEIYLTSSSNITAIIKLIKPEKYLVTNDFDAVVLPYSTSPAGQKITKDSYVIADKSCGDYYQVKENTSDNRGWWVEKKSLKRVGNDVDPTFDWMVNVKLDDLGSNKFLSEIKNNRAGINDRSNKDIYGINSLRMYTIVDNNGVKHQKGFFYSSMDQGYPDIISGTDFQKRLEKLILDELAKEGSYGSINAYDGEVFTWGKGFAVTGTLMDVLAQLIENKNINFEQIFANVGIKIVDGSLWVINEEGAWLKDTPPKKADYLASKYIRGSKVLMSFFIELAEKKGYQKEVMNAQYSVLQSGDGSANYPEYILNKDNTGYAENWNDESVTILAHLSHWCGYSWSQGQNRYKDTKGELGAILYKYIYNTVVNYPSVRQGPVLQTNIFTWNLVDYTLLEKLKMFGLTKPAALTELNSTWSSNLIDLEFKYDKQNIKRAVKKDSDKYVSNTQIVLIKMETGFIVLTFNGTAITYEEFKP
ncbi:MAG: hypothetical protein JSS79_19785, partial [Bacteroidetes bacterium]|nr:hypothetical protein [Bacteroidota bacterium]